MRNKKSHFIFLLAAVLFSAAFSGTGCQRSQGKPLRLGYLVGDLHHLPALVALEKKLFEQADLTVEVAGVFPAGPEEMAAFRAGELDIGYVGIAPVVSSVANAGAEVKILSLVNEEGSAIVVPSGSGIGSLPDLRGKFIAVPGYSTVQDLLLRIALEERDVPPNSIKTVVVKPPEMGEALRQKSVSAFIAWEPFAAMAVHSGEGKILLSSSDIWPHHPCCVLILSESALRARPDLGERLRNVHQKAIAFISLHPEESIDIAVKRTGIQKDIIREALTRISYTPNFNPKHLKRYVHFLAEMKYIKIKDENEFLNRLLSECGK